jgi:hypothetical protein
MARNEPGRGAPLSADEIESFVRDFEACTLPKPRWTHHAHLLVGLWYLSKHAPAEALNIVRRRIRAYNVAVGTANTDTGGYHETLTRLYLEGIAAHLARHSTESMPETLALLFRTPLARSDWPLGFYSRERLFSVRARHEWVEPDLPAHVALDGSDTR